MLVIQLRTLRRLRRLRSGLDPFAVFADKVDEPVDGFHYGDVEFDGLLTNVEVDFPGSAADVAEVRVGHFARAVDDATHDRDLHPFEVLRAVFDSSGDRLQIKERAAAGRTRN